MGSEAEKKAGIDEKVVAAAEREMRRPAPQTNPQPKKRRKGNEVDDSCVETSGLPRYDYSALDNLEDGVKGFLVSCVQERQMSALSEFMTFIKDYLPLDTGTVNKHKQFQSDSGDKKGEGDTITSDDQEKTSLGISEPSAKGTKPKVKPEEKTDIPRVALRPIRLSCTGVLFLKLDNWQSLPMHHQPTNVVRKIISGLERNGRLEYCQRIFPVENVCKTDDVSMKRSVAVAIQEFRKQQEAEESKLYETFAVGFKGRKKLTAADRKATIEVLASGVEEALLPHEIKVDLKNPTVALMCEMVPTSKLQVACLCLVEGGLLSSGSSIKLKATGMYGK